MTLTVIIPVHNDEIHLHRLLRHMRQLNFASHVIICDDGSEPAVAFDPLPTAVGLPPEQITLLRQEIPGGAGAARNLALQHVATDHVMFLDADDLPLRELPDLLRDLVGKTFDFCIFQHHDSRRSTEGKWGQMPSDQHLWHAAAADVGSLSVVSSTAALNLCQTANYPWNKIYRTDFLREHDIQCTEIMVHNDIELHWRSFLNARTILASDRVGVVHYVASDQNRLTNRNGPERLQVFTALSRVSAKIRSSEKHRPFAIPYYRFATGLLHWINGSIRTDLQPEFARQTRDFIQAEVPTDIQAMMTKDQDTPLEPSVGDLSVRSMVSPVILEKRPEQQVWLHVGLPKCGSTTLQQHMSKSAELHQTQGVCYPQSWRAPDGYRNHLPLAKLAPESLPQALDEIISEALNRQCSRIVLSCEHWTNAFSSSNLLRLHATLRAQFPDWQVRVVAYFRNPYDFVESSYAQYVRAGLFQISRRRFYADGAPSIEKFLACFEDSWGFPLYSNLQFARLLTEHFTSEELLLRSISPQDLAEPDMLADFCRLLELPAPETTQRSNQRVSIRKLAELEYVQTLTDLEGFARLRPMLLQTNVTGSADLDILRSSTLHIDLETAEAITQQIEKERAELRKIFSTGIKGLCEIRSTTSPSGWVRSDPLSENDRIALRAFVNSQMCSKSKKPTVDL
ncbi:glycosyltransferase family 2 protein [Pseudophaeobacter sp. A-200-2]|uniref:glycosyltransferase family 2 protein n=1 Tax=Pseudophaeobacter sp. A-200-2 TaxID=3098145 RepID=UPI0034D4322E